ncbi:hypothetical protein AURDEDRAFT_110853 [Auricularia subglabra TFB-10046 SS5]|nr:hypothetical protein AURDEDRAFT_110853 [Auricularia subglabra TFB-10046 SS5]
MSTANESTAKSQQPLAQNAAAAQYNDCMACRVVGTTALTGLGAYALFQSRRAAPGSPLGKRITAVVGVALIMGGGARFFS